MKTFLAVIGGVVVLGVVVAMFIGWLARNGALPDTGRVSRTLVGTWRLDGTDDENTKMSFTESGATLWTMPSPGLAALLYTCNVSGTYTVEYYNDLRGKSGNTRTSGTYVHAHMVGKSGNCADTFASLPVDFYDKVDVVDSNHLLVDQSSWVRSN